MFFRTFKAGSYSEHIHIHHGMVHRTSAIRKNVLIDEDLGIARGHSRSGIPKNLQTFVVRPVMKNEVEEVSSSP